MRLHYPQCICLHILLCMNATYTPIHTSVRLADLLGDQRVELVSSSPGGLREYRLVYPSRPAGELCDVPDVGPGYMLRVALAAHAGWQPLSGIAYIVEQAVSIRGKQGDGDSKFARMVAAASAGDYSRQQHRRACGYVAIRGSKAPAPAGGYALQLRGDELHIDHFAGIDITDLSSDDYAARVDAIKALPAPLAEQLLRIAGGRLDGSDFLPKGLRRLCRDMGDLDCAVRRSDFAVRAESLTSAGWTPA